MEEVRVREGSEGGLGVEVRVKVRKGHSPMCHYAAHRREKG